MNRTLFSSLALALALSKGAVLTYAESSNTTGAVSASVQSLRKDVAPMNGTPELPPTDRSPFLLKLILDPQADIRDRLEAVQEVGNSLSRSEIDSMFSFLKNHPDSQEKNMAGLRALKNDVMNALKDQNPPTGLTTTLINIFHDQAQDFATRDYAIQHLATWYRRSTEDSADAKARIRSILKEASREETSIAGTALLAMHRLSAQDTSFDSADIDQTALRMVISSNTPAPALITALQVCSDRGLLRALPEIEHLAQTRGRTALQISAIAALGKLGTAEDAVLLQKLEREGSAELHPALAAARKRMSWRLAIQEPF